MANTIAVGLNYFNRFATGQGVVASPFYYTYAIDLDVTLTTILNTLNIHTAEINNVQGPGSTLTLDILQMDDLTYRAVPLDDGLIGIGSYFPTIRSGTPNRIDVSIGSALAAGLKVSSAAAAVLTATDQGGSETDVRFLSITSQGNALLSHLPAQGIFDAWHFDFATPSEVLSNPTRLAHVLQDGDDWEQMRRRRGTAPFFEGIDSLEFHDNGGSPDTITRTVGDFTSDGFVDGMSFNVDGSALNDDTYAITAAVTATTITVATGSFTAEGPSREIRLSAGHFLFNDFDQVHERIEQLEDILAGLSPSSLLMLFPAGTAALPSIAAVGDPNTGIYWPAADEVALTAGGVHVVRAHGGSAEPEQLRAVDGTLVNPAYSFQTDPTSGLRSPGVDQLALVVNEIDAIEIDALGNVDLPTNSRVKGVVTSLNQSFSDGSAIDVRFNAADAFDVGGWHTPGDDTAGEEFLVPTDGDGLYAIVVSFAWAAPVTDVRQMLLEITLDTVQIQKVQREIPISEVWADTFVVYEDLDAAEKVRARFTQNSASAAALILSSASISIVKVA
jgi:hypothetical protein